MSDTLTTVLYSKREVVMPNALPAMVRRVIRPPHLVTIEETNIVKVSENGKFVDSKVTVVNRKEWRVVAVVNEDFRGDKEVTLSRPSEEEAAKLVEGVIAYYV